MPRLTDRFLAMAQQQPEATALVHLDRRITYGELHEQVRRIAAAAGAVAGGRPLALHATKTPGTVATMLGCLLAGVPYVPIDPMVPAARRGIILADCGARQLMVDPAPGVRPPELPDGTDVAVTDLTALLEAEAAGPPAEPSHIANILYTSGSTGMPKGVLTTHDNALTFLRWAQDLMRVRPGDVLACYAPLHFDMHIFDLFGSLSQGATVLLLDDRVILFPETVCRTLRQERATSMYAVPSAWIGLLRSRALADGGLPDLHTLMYSGEEFPVPSLRQLAARLPGVRIVNIYGPVETNAVTALDVTPEHLGLDRIPIGLPFGDSRVFLIDEAAHVVTEPGVEGEIVVNSATLCEGYLGDPAMTAASRLIVDEAGEPLPVYRTGDFGCWDADGLLHFRGRRDGRVKTRGFRVELGEVEARIVAHPAVRDAVVSSRPHPERTNELIAWVTLRDGATVTGDDLVAWCRELLPAYMLPREVRLLDQLPQTGTGKADRVALKEMAAREVAVR